MADLSNQTARPRTAPAPLPTREQVCALYREAAAAGDASTVADCRLALLELRGHRAALRRLARVLASAAAQRPAEAPEAGGAGL